MLKLILLIGLMLLLAAEVPPAIASIVTTVVALVAAVIVHFAFASRIAAVIGVIAGLFGTMAPVFNFLPAKLALPIAIVGLALTSLNERLQGGLSKVVGQ